MGFLPDISAYFRRIGYSGAATPNLETLRAILLNHIQAIPFENLNVLLGKPVSLEPADLEQKLVRSGRGGYCFEQNGYLLEVLLALGFKATPHSARVRLQTPRDVTPPRTHLFVRVELDGTAWLCDVGIGAFSPGAPLRMNLLQEEQPALEPRRITQEGGRYFHQIRLGQEWSDVYEFTGEDMPRIDRELANYYTSTNPSSRFKNHLLVGRAGSDGTRYSILDREFTHRKGPEILTRRELKTEAELRQHLADYFALHVDPDAPLILPAAHGS